MSRHRLTKIDLVARTAHCSVCGPTELYVSQPRTTKPPEVRCIQQAMKELQYMRDWRRKRKKPTRPLRHTLREIDEEKRTAVCAICGPTNVYKSKSAGRIIYRCANPVREYERQQRSAHIFNPNATVHILYHIDEENQTAICLKCGPVMIEWNYGPFSAAGRPGAVPTDQNINNPQAQENARIIYEYKRQHACKRCKSMAILEPNGFGFFELHLPREQRISALVETAEPEELLAELEKRDMYCYKCLSLVIRAFVNNMPMPEFQPFPTQF